MDNREISNRFTYHAPPTPDAIELHARIRTACAEAALIFDEIMSDGREKSTAITKLEEAMFWANAGIARPKS